MKLLIITQKVDKNDDVLGFFHGWISHFSKKFSHVSVIALAKGRVELPDTVTVYSLGKERGAYTVVKIIRFYYYLLKTLPFVDGVFVHMAPEYVRALYPLNIIFRKPIIMWYAHIHVSGVAKWALSHVDTVFTPSKESFTTETSKVISTGHGIDTDVFHPSGQNNSNTVKVIFTVSRISKVKRIETLIDAVRILVDRGEKNFVVHIAGGPARPEDFEYLTSLQKRVHDSNISSFIVWLGPVSSLNTPQLYQKADVFVRMQGGGGFGKTELEAMATGVPSIVPTPVYQQSLEEYGKELFFEEDNSDMLASTISRVLSWNEEKRGRYRDIARNFVVQNHNIKNVAQAVFSSLQAIVAHKQ